MSPAEMVTAVTTALLAGDNELAAELVGNAGDPVALALELAHAYAATLQVVADVGDVGDTRRCPCWWFA